MAHRTPFAVGEWYHCYNRGVDKRRVFTTTRDYDRFVGSLYLANASHNIHFSNIRARSLSELLEKEIDRGDALVEVGAWCLMPNHVHILVREAVDGGIAAFMQKLFTGYTMYFNKKTDRTGPLFAGVFKSRHVADDRYLKHLVSYIHMNPIEISIPEWESGSVSVSRASEVLQRYTYSSLHAFEKEKISERAILGESIFELYDTLPKRGEMLKEAREYHLEHPEF